MKYVLKISKLFRVHEGVAVGAEAKVAIKDGDNVVETLTLRGKVGPAAGVYRRGYEGKPGLSAVLLDGPCAIEFSPVAQDPR